MWTAAVTLSIITHGPQGREIYPSTWNPSTIRQTVIQHFRHDSNDRSGHRTGSMFSRDTLGLGFFLRILVVVAQASAPLSGQSVCVHRFSVFICILFLQLCHTLHYGIVRYLGNLRSLLTRLNWRHPAVAHKFCLQQDTLYSLLRSRRRN
jgi:hypothetical protein